MRSIFILISVLCLGSGCAEDATTVDQDAKVTTDDTAEPDASVAYEEPEADPASLEALGIETLVTSDCMGPEEGFDVPGPSTAPFGYPKWSFQVLEDAEDYAAAYARVGNVAEPPEVDFETSVVIAIELGEWAGCGQRLELMGARELDEVIEVDARFVRVNGDDGASWPYLFASAPRSEKPYEVVQRQPRCPGYRLNGKDY